MNALRTSVKWHFFFSNKLCTAVSHWATEGSSTSSTIIKLSKVVGAVAYFIDFLFLLGLLLQIFLFTCTEGSLKI
ncbi:hypothetical protein NC651_000731 [Populus alba x Populus x berolinensis]|nr:hypothetical protein NC651_000731 [Populus alba x Populus x berolinensis]